jgi:hypothetical protein
MYSLNEQQIDFILDDISARGIRMEELRLSLLDHICIIIEQNLPPNGDFEKFYASAIKEFYKVELYEIEQETIHLLKRKNRYSMKKFMIISGTFSVAAFMVSSLFKILHSPFTDFLQFLGFISFVFLFLPSMFILRMKETGTGRDRLILASGTVAGILYFFCMLLKFLGPQWPSFLGQRWANLDTIWLALWLAALGIALFVFLPAYFFKGIGSPETKTNTITISIFLVAFIGVQFRFTNLRLQKPREQNHSAQIQGDRSPEKKMPAQTGAAQVILVSEPSTAVREN